VIDTAGSLLSAGRPKRDDPTQWPTIRTNPVGIGTRRHLPGNDPDRDHPALPVVAAVILGLDHRAREQLGGISEVEPMLGEVRLSLAPVPIELHGMYADDPAASMA
jgi:hypothetical protein